MTAFNEKFKKGGLWLKLLYKKKTSLYREVLMK